MSFVDYPQARSPQSMAFTQSPLLRSRVASPQAILPDHRATTPFSVATAQQTINEWFEQLIEIRRLKAVLIHAALSSILYLLCACLLQFSPLHPLITTSGILTLFTSAHTILFVVGYALMNTISTYIIGRFLLQFDREKRLSKRDWRIWCIFTGFLLLDNVKGFLLFKGSGITFVRGIIVDASSFVVHVPVFVATFLNVFECDYRLKFPAVEFGAFHQMKSALCLGPEFAWKELFPVAKLTIIFTFLCGLPLYGLALFPGIFSVPVIFSTMVLAHSQAILHYFSLKSLKAFVVQPYTFALPPVHAGIESTTEQSHTLPKALESSSVNLKTFAFWDLRKLSASSYHRRVVLFSLSQPGGHPRNWNAIRGACMNILEQINTRIVDENARIRRENFVSVNRFWDGSVKKIGGPTILLPNQLRREQQLRQRIMKEQPSVAATTTAAAALWQRIRSLLAGQRLIVSAFEETLAILSIESLCMLVWHSYEEDRYGVVQNDLNAIISQMLQLVVSLDRYIHHIRSTREAQQSPSDLVYYSLRNALCSALSRIAARFKGSLKAIQLSDEQLTLLNSLTQAT